MKDLAGGAIDCFKVSCCWCFRVEHFHPPHAQTYRARFQARALGWFFSGRGWQCPKYNKQKGVTEADKIQTTLPGFGHLSRNAN